MCIAIPGEVLELEGTRGKVNIRGYVTSVELGIVDAKPGDFVLVHAGCAISVVGRDEALEIQELFDLLEQYEHADD